MSSFGWMVIENIAILASVCFLVWLTGSGWWVLMAMFMNMRTYKKGENND